MSISGSSLTRTPTESPYTNISSGRAADAHIVLSYIPGVHFQSLCPTGQATVSSVADEPPAKKARLSHADRTRLASAMEPEDVRESSSAGNDRRMAEAGHSESSSDRERGG